jgi:ABC-type multidrug transport system fused ATPase/permease subunit
MKRSSAYLKEFIGIIIYCFNLSWQANALYTLLRLLVRVTLLFLVIMTTYSGRRIIDLLSLSNDRGLIITWTVISSTLGLIIVCANRYLEYMERLHSTLIENSTFKQLIDKALNAELSLYDKKIFYDNFSIVKRDSISLPRLLLANGRLKELFKYQRLTS